LRHVIDAAPFVAGQKTDIDPLFGQNFATALELQADAAALGFVQTVEIARIEVDLAVAHGNLIAVQQPVDRPSLWAQERRIGGKLKR
jgi:hypothetical protein